MNIKLRYYLFSITLLTPGFAYAVFCPTNFTQINIGDTIEHITAACGKPDTTKKSEMEKPVPQEWTYYLPQDVAVDTGVSGPAMLKTTMSFDKDGKAINISVNGIGIGATTICGNNVQLGNTIEQIKTACGKPSFVVKQEPANEEEKKQEKIAVTEFFYKSNPPAKLRFEAGKLVKIE